MDYNKKFLILGNNNAITYKEIFPYIKNNELWLGKTLFTGKMPYFKVSENYTLENDRYERRSDGLYKQVNGICWFTNIPHNKNKEPLVLTKTYNPIDYPKYDNYDAIEVSKTKDIPIDYDGVMGVPITFLDKYCNSQFEILGYEHNVDGNGTSVNQFELNRKGVYKRLLIKKNVEFEIVKFRKGDDDKDLSVNGYTPYFRILIKKNAEFEIIGLMSGAKDDALINGNDGRAKFYVNGKGVYARILIKRIK